MVLGQLADYRGGKKSLISIAHYNETVKVMKEYIDDYLLECILELEKNFLSVKPKKQIQTKLTICILKLLYGRQCKRTCLIPSPLCSCCWQFPWDQFCPMGISESQLVLSLLPFFLCLKQKLDGWCCSSPLVTIR